MWFQISSCLISQSLHGAMAAIQSPSPWCQTQYVSITIQAAATTVLQNVIMEIQPGTNFATLFEGMRVSSQLLTPQFKKALPGDTTTFRIFLSKTSSFDSVSEALPILDVIKACQQFGNNIKFLLPGETKTVEKPKHNAFQIMMESSAQL